MAWIKMIEEEKAEGKLKKLYKKMANPTNQKVANVLKVHSIKPDILEAHFNLYRKIMFGKSDISRKQREMIAVLVSSVNECHYWIEHHGAALHKLSDQKNLKKEIIHNYQASKKLTKKEKVMLDYAKSLTIKPTSVKVNIIKRLKNMGFSGEDILDINQVVSYFNYVNRIVEGLGVNLETEGGNSD